MAIDTETKRRSTLRPIPSIPVLPLPDGTVDRVDSAHMFVYSGIAIIGSVADLTGAIKPILPIKPIATVKEGD